MRHTDGEGRDAVNQGPAEPGSGVPAEPAPPGFSRALAMLIAGGHSRRGSWWWTFSGVCRSVGFSAYNTVAFADVPADKMAQENTLHATLQELGAGLGIAIGALLVRLGDPVGQALGRAKHLPPPTVAFVLLAVLMIAPLVEALTMPASAGGAVTGRG